MKYLSEFRDPEVAQALLREIKQTVTRPWVIMKRRPQPTPWRCIPSISR